MSAEIIRRAAVHAALSDPTRLAIVDALTVGDLSPSKLAAHLQTPSNLLAHHLDVLESHGLITRARSEGDRRRTYLRLNSRAFEGLLPSGERRARRVLFVCTANSARSVLAAALWRRASTVPAASAGTHPATQIHPGALAAAARHQLPLRPARPHRLRDVHRDGDLVITVCDSAHEELGALAELHWSVPDPVKANTRHAFDTAFGDLASRIDAVTTYIVPA